MYCYLRLMDNNQQQQMMPQDNFYKNFSKSLFSGDSEKSFVDKLLGRQDADKLHALMQKEPLTKSDVEEILFLMTSINQKIVNYDEWDRYVIVKFFPWIKAFSTICKTWMIYEDQYDAGDFDGDFDKILKVTDMDEEIIKKLPRSTQDTITKVKQAKKDMDIRLVLEETKKIVHETSKYLQHHLKYLISIFILVSNTTLSIDGAAFETLTTSRFEYSYPTMPMPQPQQKGMLYNLFGKKR